MRVWLDFPTDDRESVETDVNALPRVGETVGITLNAPPNEQYRQLDKVLEVRHYPRAFARGERCAAPEVRVLLGS